MFKKSQSKKNRPQRRLLTIETMEDRKLFAADWAFGNISSRMVDTQEQVFESVPQLMAADVGVHAPLANVSADDTQVFQKSLAETAGMVQYKASGIDDHGDSPETATQLSGPSSSSGQIETEYDVDFFTFDATAETTYVIETVLGTLPDSTLRLVGSDGVTALARDDDGGDGYASSIQWQAIESGPIFVEVAGYGTATGEYSLRVSSLHDDHGDSPATATNTSEGTDNIGRIEIANDTDVFTFDTDAGAEYQLEILLGTLPDSILRLIGTDGVTLLDFDDDGGDGYASSIRWRAIDSGPVFVEVAGYLTDVGDYTLRITEVRPRGDFDDDGSYLEQDQVFAFEELSGPEANAQFGTAVAVDGDTMVVGAKLKDLPGETDAGAVFVYIRNDNGTPLNSSDDFWQPQAQLIASDAAADDQFGTSVAISGDTIVVGSNYDDHGGRPDAGAAYVFTRDGDRWSERAKLTSSHAAENDRFGNSVSIHDETIVVGSIGDDHTGGSAAGSAYVFTHTGGTWSQTTKLTANDARAFDQFGASVAVSGDTIVVGSRWDDYYRGPFLAALNNAGSAYVFTRSGGIWSEQAKLTAADPAHEAIFGGDVSISGETIVVGSVGDEHAGFSSGSAYVFARLGNSWSQQAKLTASDAGAFDRFGGAVSISNETIVVGSSDGVVDSGSAYVFTRYGDDWSQHAKLTAEDGATIDSLGSAVAISGDTIVVGSPGYSLAGSAYVFVARVPGDSNGDGLLSCADVDALVAAIVEGNNPPQFDLTGDEIVDSADLDEWLILAGSENLPSGQAFSPGDANLDGKVDAIDLNAVGLNWRQGVSGWCSGDFTADGVVNASDLNALAINWRNDVSGEAAAAVVAARAPHAPLANRVADATTASSQERRLADRSTSRNPTEKSNVEYGFEARRSRYDGTRTRRDSVRGNEALAQIEYNEVKIVDELFAKL